MFNLQEIILMHPPEKYVTIDKDIVGGTPVFKGTRVTVKTLFDYLEESSLEDFLTGHPSVSREQAEAVIELASEKFLTELIS
jgi:uncharacterized protein (DUF433 family)